MAPAQPSLPGSDPGSHPGLVPELNPGSARVAILLSTFNGAAFLAAQLASLQQQTLPGWTLYWRDDGSNDGTQRVMRDFMAGPEGARCIEVAELPGRLGPAGSFMALLRAAAAADPDVVAFADQDDVWLPEKLALGVAALGSCAAPSLYCSRQVLVDQELRRIRESEPLRHPPGFPAALTQNIATGCTVQLNRAAVRLVASSQPPPTSLHDWWCYLVVAATGGRLIADDTPTVLYRQHPGNLVGAPPSMLRRGVAALRRGPGIFMGVLRGHVSALRAQPHLLSEEAAGALEVLDIALHSRFRQRVKALWLGGLTRQTWPETLVFRCWFLIG